MSHEVLVAGVPRDRATQRGLQAIETKLARLESGVDLRKD